MSYIWPKSGAYKLINKDSVSALKRLRKSNSFIVDTRDFPNLDCDLCKKAITPKDGNRATYFPKTKVLQVMHYYCSWQHLFGQIYSIDNTARIKVDHLEFVYINGHMVGLA